MPKSEKIANDAAAKMLRSDPYEVLGVPKNSTDQEIKTAYRKMALKYHPDKNANDPKAAEMFKEVTFSYSILSDPDKRHQFDTAGFEAVESDSQELELDLSSLGAVNTIFAALFSLSQCLGGGTEWYGVSSSTTSRTTCVRKENEAEAGLVCRVQSADKSKFKVST